MILAALHKRPVAWAWALVCSMPVLAHAQVNQAMFMGGQQQPAAQRANYQQSGDNPWVDAHGQPVVVPASYCGDACGPAGPGPFSRLMQGGRMGPGCGGLPCGMPGGGPYGPGGPYGMTGLDPSLDRYGSPNVGVDQCGPHYFDFSAEAVYWQKERVADPEGVNFATIGINDITQGVAGDLLLSTNDLGFDWEPGMRLTGRYDLGALSLIEVQYSGLYEWGSVALLDDPNNPDNIYTAFSNFGIGFDTNGDGTPDQAVDGAGLTSTEDAATARLELLSELHNAEISIRRYWLGFSPRVTGTWMAGVRYTRLTEKLNFSTTGIGGNSQFSTRVDNDLVGFQAGGDVWVTVRQGLRLGAQGKAGLYNNRIDNFQNISASQLAGPVVEQVKGDRGAFITEGNVSCVWDVHPNVSLRAGYDVLFINTVALAANNFDFDNSVFFGGTRNPRIIEESSALYHGANVGFEYVW